MLPEVESLVGAVDNDGIVRKAVLIEVVEETSDIFIDGFNAAQVILDVSLVVPASAIFAFEIGGEKSFVLGTEVGELELLLAN